MSFITWYKVEIDEGGPPKSGLLAAAASLLGIGLPVKVSNDVLSGAYILDADMTVSLQTGAVASVFEVKFTNLPTDISDLLKAKQKEGLGKADPRPLQIKIFLGYFDDLPQFRGQKPVLEGVVTWLKSEVNDDGVMETTLRGQEITGFALRMACNEAVAKADDQPIRAFIEDLLKKPGITLAPGHKLTKQLKDYTNDGRNALDALRRIVDEFNIPVVLLNNNAFINEAVGAGDPIATLTENNDIVKEDDELIAEEFPDRCRKDASGKTPPPLKPRPSLSIHVLGNPLLQPGKIVKVQHADKPEEEKWRIEQVDHHFSSSTGFVTDLKLIQQEKPGDTARDPGGANGVVQRFQDVVESTQRTPVDVGEIREYRPGSDGKHLATLKYGQTPPAGTVVPSVATPIDDTQLLNKPIASPFAFHKCGLIVPVYPKMRALLGHNRGLTNDAAIMGFLWAENPRQEPPKNKPGDYWLCLPTGLSDGLPSGKGVNDLTDASGQRVIQAKGVKIFVGSDDLPDVGERPTIPSDLDGSIVIEHEKGAKVTIGSDGSIAIETNKQDISVTTGSVTLKLGGSSPELSATNGSVTLKMSGSTVEVS